MIGRHSARIANNNDKAQKQLEIKNQALKEKSLITINNFFDCLLKQITIKNDFELPTNWINKTPENFRYLKFNLYKYPLVRPLCDVELPTCSCGEDGCDYKCHNKMLYMCLIIY
jgi:hypothetical protein